MKIEKLGLHWQKSIDIHIMIRIDAPHFCAGAVVENSAIVDAAPIIKWMIGKTIDQVMDYCHRKKWACQILRWANKKGAP